jgi:hypothetical protein
MRALFLSLLFLAACATAPVAPVGSRADDRLPLHPNETAELRHLINHFADTYDVPRSWCTGSCSAKACIAPKPGTVPTGG